MRPTSGVSEQVSPTFAGAKEVAEVLPALSGIGRVAVSVPEELDVTGDLEEVVPHPVGVECEVAHVPARSLLVDGDG